MHAGGLPDDDGRGQHPAPGDLQQRRRQNANQIAQLPLEVVDLGGQLLTAAQQPPRDPGDDAVEALQLGEEFRNHSLAAQPTARDLEVGVELVEVPARPLGDCKALNDQIMAVIRQQLDLSGGPVEFSDRQVWVTQRG